MSYLKDLNKKKFFEEQQEYGEFLEKNTAVGKVLAENGYKIYDINQANQNFRQIMRLDENEDILTIAIKKQDGKSKLDFESISKENFWNAFYEPIWAGLGNREKLQAVNWLFDYLVEKNNLDVKLTFIPETRDFADDLTYGVSFEKPTMFKQKKGSEQENIVAVKNYIYLNYGKIIEDDKPYETICTVVHELEHAKQKKYIQSYDCKTKSDYYTVSQLSMYHFPKFNFKDINVGDNVKRALYRLSQNEIAAELQGMKAIKKIQKFNEEKYGKNQEIDKNVNYFAKDIFVGRIPLYGMEETNGLLSNELVVLKGQGQNLIQLMMLKTYYENLLSVSRNKSFALEQKSMKLFNDIQNDIVNRRDVEDVFEKIREERKEVKANMELSMKKIKLVKEIFSNTLSTGELPEDFDSKKEFEVLNISYENNSNNLIPKKLNNEIVYGVSMINDELRKRQKFENSDKDATCDDLLNKM